MKCVQLAAIAAVAFMLGACGPRSTAEKNGTCKPEACVTAPSKTAPSVAPASAPQKTPEQKFAEAFEMERNITVDQLKKETDKSQTTYRKTILYALGLYIEAGEKVPGIKEDVARITRKIVAFGDIDDLVDAWDQGADREIMNPALERWYQRHLARASSKGFVLGRRYRLIDTANVKMFACGGSLYEDDVYGLVQIGARLHPDSKETKLLRLADNDLNSLGDCSQKENLFFVPRTTYEEYVELGYDADAQWVARLMIKYRNDEFTDNFYQASVEDWRLEPTNAWLQLLPKEEQQKLLQEEAKKQMKTARTSADYKTVAELYQAAGDTVASQRMQIIASAK